MNVARNDPLALLERFQQEVNRLLHEDPAASAAAGTRAPSAVTRAASAPGTWIPAVDVKEEASRFLILADVPGVRPDGIEITMEDGVLSIKGERKCGASGEQGDGYRRIERRDGVFHRRFSLPDTADASGIAARSTHGVLEVSIPKKRAVQPRRIQVQ